MFLHHKFLNRRGFLRYLMIFVYSMEKMCIFRYSLYCRLALFFSFLAINIFCYLKKKIIQRNYCFGSIIFKHDIYYYTYYYNTSENGHKLFFLQCIVEVIHLRHTNHKKTKSIPVIIKENYISFIQSFFPNGIEQRQFYVIIHVFNTISQYFDQS